MNSLTLQDLKDIETYKNSGRLVFIKPIKKTISLSGGQHKPFKEALTQIRECLNRESLK